MSEEVFKESLKAKVDISVNIGRIFDREKLDFVKFYHHFSHSQKPRGRAIMQQAVHLKMHMDMN